MKVSLVIDIDGHARDLRVGPFGLSGVSTCVEGVLSRVRSRERPDTGTVAASFELRFVPRPL